MRDMFRLLSHLWPVRVGRFHGPHGTIDLVWENGSLVVNSANANQSWGSLQRVWERVFLKAHIAERPVGSALVLGMGAGGVVKLIQRMQPQVRITAVDDDPVMIRIAREYFGVDSDAGTTVVEQDAFRFLEKDRGSYDLIVVDLFEDTKVAGALFAVGTLRMIQTRLAAKGLLLMNTMLDTSRASALGAHASREGFSVNWCRPFPENRVMIGSIAGSPIEPDDPRSIG